MFLLKARGGEKQCIDIIQALSNVMVKMVVGMPLAGPHLEWENSV